MLHDETLRDQPIILLGGGGHAKVLAYTLQLCGRRVIGYTDLAGGAALLGIPRLGTDAALSAYAPSDVLLVNGLGSTGHADARKKVFEELKARGYTFESVAHPSAIIAPDVELGEGVQVLAGAVIHPGSVIGANTIINTRASVDHDCLLGRHVHIAPGATLSGGVRIGDEAHVGTGASIVHGITVGARAIVGAGAVVIRPVADGSTVVGVPAQPITPRAHDSKNG